MGRRKSTWRLLQSLRYTCIYTPHTCTPCATQNKKPCLKRGRCSPSAPVTSTTLTVNIRPPSAAHRSSRKTLNASEAARGRGRRCRFPGRGAWPDPTACFLYRPHKRRPTHLVKSRTTAVVYSSGKHKTHAKIVHTYCFVSSQRARRAVTRLG